MARDFAGRIGAHLPCLLLAAAHSAPTLACEGPPPVVRDLDIPRFYADPKGSVVDPKQRALHDAAVEPLKLFLQTVVAEADRAVQAGHAGGRRPAACALGWVEAWAQGDAWLGKMAQAQAEYQRKWDLVGVALAYLKLRAFASPEQRRVIEPWLQRIADAARAFFDDRNHKRNNHWYWLGLGIGGVALATDSDKHWAIARAIMQDAARDIGADGTLPMELARGGRALHYHAFSVMPVVLLAELGTARGESWYGLEDGAVHRLVEVTLRGLADPALFADLAGVTQQPNAGAGGGWLHLYLRRFPERIQGLPLPSVARGHRWIGGDAVVLGEVLARRNRQPPQ